MTFELKYTQIHGDVDVDAVASALEATARRDGATTLYRLRTGADDEGRRQVRLSVPDDCLGEDWLLAAIAAAVFAPVVSARDHG